MSDRNTPYTEWKENGDLYVCAKEQGYARYGPTIRADLLPAIRAALLSDAPEVDLRRTNHYGSVHPLMEVSPPTPEGRYRLVEVEDGE